MSFIFNEAKYQELRAGIPLHTDDIRALLVMSDSNADVSRNAQTLDGITVLDELDAPGYTAGGVALTGESVQRDAVLNRAFFTSNHPSFPNLAPGTRPVKGAIMYAWRGSLGASIPIAYYDAAPHFPFTPNGTTATIQWNALGALQLL